MKGAGGERRADEKKEKQKNSRRASSAGNHEYEQGGGIALEAQDFTDFLHHQEFPSCVLEPGQAMTRVFELRWGSVEKKKEGNSCGSKAVTVAASGKSAVGAEEMMM